MSLYKAIKKQRHFQMPFGVLNVGEVLIMIFYTGVGFLGYLQYGDHFVVSFINELSLSIKVW